MSIGVVSGHGKAWTPSETARMRKFARAGTPADEVVSAFPTRAVGSVTRQLHRVRKELGIEAPAKALDTPAMEPAEVAVPTDPAAALAAALDAESILRENLTLMTAMTMHGGRIEYRRRDDPEAPWQPLEKAPELAYDLVTGNLRYEFRHRRPSRCINGVEVPLAMKTAPAVGQAFYTPLFTAARMVGFFIWKGSEEQLLLLERGLVHSNSEDATAHAKALISGASK